MYMNKHKSEPGFRLINRHSRVTLYLLALFFWASPGVQAEPYLAIQEGYKCSKCHVNMTGGGKRTDFANIYVQTRLSSSFLNWRGLLPELGEDEDEEENPLKTDSNSSFFSGRLNDYIAIGGDFRALYERTETPGSDTEDLFNQRKQNIYLEINLIPEHVLFYQTMDGGGDAREIFGLLKWEIDKEPIYLKAGQFFLPYGLRLQDDSAFIRAVTGFTYGTTDVGLEVGYEPGNWAFHAATSNGTGSSLETNRHKRFTTSAAYVKKRYRVGASYSTNKNEEGVETKIYGVHAGAQFGRTGLLFETDKIDDETTEQQVSILELNFLIARGQNIKLSYEYHDPSEDIKENANERYSLVYEPFLNQFTQLRAGYRNSDGIPQDPASNTTSYFIELHLFL